MTKILITAGATRNPIDSMRCITANASGRTGVGIAERLAEYDVTLFGSPIACLRTTGVKKVIEFGMPCWLHFGLMLKIAMLWLFSAMVSLNSRRWLNLELLLRLTCGAGASAHLET